VEFLKKTWSDVAIVAIDLETTGKYPLDAEICEMAAVKWRNGRVVGTYQTLLKPSAPMSDAVIAIHNITNEMVANAPSLAERLAEFHAFIGDGFIVAHHAPFDMGFLTWEFEKSAMPLPPMPGFCTSLLSRNLNGAVENHRLPTLAAHFGLETGSLHRALDDAKTCLGIALKYFAQVGETATLGEIFDAQKIMLPWNRFSILSLIERDHLRILVRALRDRKDVNMVYESGSRPGQSRKVTPQGLVRQPDGDFLVALEDGEEKPKRYYIEKISKVEFV
jgi:DNA polymerase-3 subunit epsilon